MIETVINGIAMKLETSPALFSPNAVDAGTLAMLAFTEFVPDDKILDLGCGSGVVGILAARRIGADRVVLCDLSEEAVRITRLNAAWNGVPDVQVYVSDGLAGVPESGFTQILSNPPYHTDFKVAKSFIEDGYKRLLPGGKMLMVTKRRDWYKNKLAAVFGGVTVKESAGYYIFIAEKRSAARPPKQKAPAVLSRKLRRKTERGQRGRAQD
jgi:16S rRNA (guanine1207-N2)-methyltransferase